MWIAHYLFGTGTYFCIGLNMCEEVYELLEEGNNKKES